MIHLSRTNPTGMLRPLRAAVLLSLVGACSLSGAEASASAGEPGKPAKAGKPSSSPSRKPPHASPIGTNLAPVRDWSTQRAFGDLFKQSRAWISNTQMTWDDQRPLDLDARGWVRSLKPGQRARSLVVWGEPYPAGEYVVTWQGSGTVDFWPQQASFVGKGRAVIPADPARGGIAVTIESTDPKDPVRDIHVWRKGQEGALWNPAFLDGLKSYSVLRFMDWMETNESATERWDDRPVIDDARWSVKGVPLEVMVDLANMLRVDAWFTIPHTWNDDAVAKAAALVHARLKPELAAYVEHSNEVWNGMFPQAQSSRERGIARSLARDPFEAQLRQHAERSVEIFQIWEKAFATTPHRLVRVMGGMAASPWANEVLLSTKGADRHTDALAVAPYFGHSLGDPAHAVKSRSLLPEAVFAVLEQSVDEVLGLVREHKKVAIKHKVRLIAYEGGQHLVGVGPAVDDEALGAVFTAANRDPRMKALYLRYLKGWQAAGGGLFVHYLDVAAPNKFGRWGAREGLEQRREAAPKWDALVTFAETTPAWW